MRKYLLAEKRIITGLKLPIIIVQLGSLFIIGLATSEFIKGNVNAFAIFDVVLSISLIAFCVSCEESLE